MQLDGLSGALEFGAGFADAANLEQARRRAAHVFGILRKQPALSHAQSTNALGRAALLAWACTRSGTERDAAGEQALFRSVDDALDEETFVTSIERVYKVRLLHWLVHRLSHRLVHRLLHRLLG